MAALPVDGAPGCPMHLVLLSPIAHALALLQHPPRHTCSHTLALRRCAFFVHRQDLQLPPVFRAQVGYEATDPILLADNAISVLQLRSGVACFAALDVLSVCVRRMGGLMGLAAGASCVLLLLPTADPFSPCHGLGLCTWTRRLSAF